MTKTIILDTHILLWMLIKSDEISDKIKQQITKAKNDNQLMISSISLWEIAMLKFKNRINIYRPLDDFLASIAKINGLTIMDITPEIAAQSVMLTEQFHGDPADRIIVATAKICGATLLTRDSQILKWASLGHIKFIMS